MLNHDSRCLQRRALGLLFLIFGLPAISSGQPANEAASDRAALQAFAAEIRQLRITIEKTVAAIPRMQLTITRFQMQQERVDRLTRELQDFRDRLRSYSPVKEDMANSISQMETQLAQRQLNPAQRNEIEMAKKQLASRLAQQTEYEQQERTEEVELTSHLQKEQAILSDLIEQLKAIDRLLQ